MKNETISLLVNGNKMMAWILRQKDLWLDSNTFHVSNLCERFVEQHPDIWTEYYTDRMRRVVRFEAMMAANHINRYGWPEEV